MRRGWGFTLLELMVVVAIIGLLVSVLVPAVHSAKRSARLAACRAGLKSGGAALWLYAAEKKGRFPPFAFSSIRRSDLLLSGHWGGSRDSASPDLFGRFADEMSHVNLYALSREGYVSATGLHCPAAAAPLRTGKASYFAHTDQFSTYCLRFPHSEDLFRNARALRNSGIGGPDVLGVYRVAAGGHEMYIPGSSGVGRVRQTVPLVHSEQTYRTGEHVFDPAADVLVADAFWMQDHAAAADGANPVLRRRCHENQYNVLLGHGGVATVEDDGTIDANTVPPGESPVGEAPYYDQAEILWAFFDSKK